jgi:hypothetical protein
MLPDLGAHMGVWISGGEVSTFVQMTSMSSSPIIGPAAKAVARLSA